MSARTFLFGGPWRHRLWTAAGVLAVVVFATWPAVLHLDEYLAVNDPMVYAWGLWWTSDALLHLENPWFSDQMLAPTGSYLSFHALVPLAGFVLTPFIQVLGAPVVANLLKLALPVLATVTARALARETGLRGFSAWVAGLLFGCSTILVWRTTFHLNFGAGLALLPLAPLFAMRLERTGARRDAVLLGVAMAAIVLCDPTIAIFAAFAVGTYLLVSLVRDRGTWRRWATGLALAVVVGGVLSAPQIAMMARASGAGGYDPDPAVLASNWTGANTNVETMFSPGYVRDWFPGGLENRWYVAPDAVGEATPTYGWAALGLALALLIGLVVRRRRRSDAPAPITGSAVVWAVVLFLGASVLALGPEWTWSTDAAVPFPIERDGQELSAVMPYTWLVELPFFGDLRIPSRFTMLAILPLALLAGAGFSLLWRSGRAWRVLAVAALAFGVVESGFPDGGMGGAWAPIERPELYAPVKADKSETLVVDIPLGFAGGTAGAGRTPGAMEPMLYAIEHGHPIAAGYMTRITAEQIQERMARPFYAGVIARQDPLPAGQDDPLPAFDAPAAADSRTLGVGWVVVWPTAAKERIVPFLRASDFVRVHVVDGIELWHRKDLAER